jgi:hypothetical protein
MLTWQPCPRCFCAKQSMTFSASLLFERGVRVDDFSDHNVRLFLMEMQREGKKEEEVTMQEEARRGEMRHERWREREREREIEIDRERERERKGERERERECKKVGRLFRISRYN